MDDREVEVDEMTKLVRALGRELTSLKAEIRLIRLRTTFIDYRMWASARAALGLPVNELSHASQKARGHEYSLRDQPFMGFVNEDDARPR